MNTIPLLVTALLVTADPPKPAHKVGPVPETLRKEWKLSDFYVKCVVADGLPILSSGKVRDAALLEAAFLVDRMLAGRDDVRKAIVGEKVRLAIMAPNEFTCQIPEHSDLTPPVYWNVRARGLGATRARPAVSCGEENLLEFPGDPYQGESILMHEFAHVIHQMGLRNTDRGFQKKLRVCYDEAKKENLWPKTYAMTNAAEYWAEAVQSWFHCNLTNDSQHGPVNSRKQLRTYDPRMAALLEEAFPKNEWVWNPPSKRPAPGHLKGFDLKGGSFRWPPKMQKEYDEYLRSNKGKESE